MMPTISIVLALVAASYAASTSSGDTNQELTSKLKILEQKQEGYQQTNDKLTSKLEKYQPIIDDLVSKLAEVTANLKILQKNQQNLLDEIAVEQEARRELEVVRQNQDKENQNLQMTVEVLQTKLQSTTDECNSIKVQLIKLFSSFSSVKQIRKKEKSTDNNSTAVDVEEIRQSGTLNTDDLSDDEIKIAEQTKSGDEFKEDDTEGQLNHITATLQITGSTGGVSYIRWGRTSCEGNANALYTGYAAGKYRTSTSTQNTGSELICLHNTPQWGNIAPNYKGVSPMSGVEYEFYDDGPFSKDNVGGQPFMHNEMPCTVCHVQARTHQLMIPGRKSCPSGWTMEYWGYLSTTHIVVPGGSYQCVDQAPEAVVNSATNQPYGQVIHAAEVFCETLPCLPYIQGYEISCVVCSK